MDTNGNGLMAQTMNYNDPSAIAAAEAVKAQIQAAYMMALHRPRNIDQARINILQNCKRPGFAERVEYAKPVGGSKIKGPTIRFAEMAIREWGNIKTDTQVVYEDDFNRRIKITVTDLESNSIHGKEFQIKKTVERKNPEGREIIGERVKTDGNKVFIVKATDDELYNKEAALISKIVRNEGLRMIPADIVDEALDIARKTLRDKDAQDPDAAKRRLIDAFVEIGVQPKDLETYLEHPLTQLAPKELEDLRTMYRSIKDGQSSWQEFTAAKDNVTDTETKTNGKAEELKTRLKKQKEPAPPQADVTYPVEVGA